MKKKSIAIIFGGRSTEHQISLQSAYAVITHIDQNRFQPYLIGITKKGCWYLYEGDPSNLPNGSWESDPSCTPAMIVPDASIHGMLVLRTPSSSTTIELDAALPILHGKFGEDGTIQGLLELANIPIIGCKTLASAIGMDKHLAHLVVSAYGIKVPEAVVFHTNPTMAELHKQTKHLTYPLFVKPMKAGSSFGISKVKDSSRLQDAVETAFEHDDSVIIETAIAGFEVGCAIMGDHDLTIGMVDEIELSQGFFDYTEKYTLQSSKIHMPARIPNETQIRIQDTAKVIYRALGCSGFARVDMFLTPEGEIYFNEVNTIPGFTAHSRFPNMLQGIGMTFGEIVNHLIERSLRPC